MKRMSKILVLILSFALIVGVIFAITASAEEATAPKYWYAGDTEEMAGAVRKHRDFTAESFDVHALVESGVKASPATSTLPTDLWISGTGKYGHTRSVTTPGGNTYLEFAFRMDDAGSTSQADNITGIHPKSQLYANDYSYIVYEFDMATPTSFPGNMRLAIEMRGFDSKGTEYSHNGSQVRPKTSLGTYSATSGEWNFGGKSLKLERGEWAHVTLVYQVNAVTNDEGLVNHGSSVIKVYINGEYYNTVTGFISDIDIASDIRWRIHYIGLGWYHGVKHTGTKADDALALDNLTLTTFDKNYVADVENANLSKLFAENAPTTLENLGPEVVWTPDYDLPEDIGCATVIDEDGNEYASADGVYDVKSAIDFIKEEYMEGATIKLYANQYNKVYIDFETAFTFDTNGYALQNGFEVDSRFSVTYDEQTGELTVEEDPTKLLTVKYFVTPKGTDGKEVLTVMTAEGREFTINTVDFDVLPYAVGNTGYAPTGNFVIYDQNGNLVAMPEAGATVGTDVIGSTWYVYPEFTTVTKTNNITFATILGGAYTFYDSTDLWAAGVSADEATIPKAIPNGTTIVLLSDATLSAPLYTLENGSVFSLDLNGHKLTLTSHLLTTSVANAPANLANNKVFVYSSAEGAEIVTTDNLLNGKNGEKQTNGVLYYLGYKSTVEKSEYRIKATFGSRIVAFTKGAFKELYIANFDLYNTVYVNSGLICAQQSRGVNFFFEDCNIFTKSPLFGSNANSGGKNITMTNTNVYATGGIPMNWIESEAAGDGSFPHGDTKLTMAASHIYGMTFGQTAGDGVANYTAKFTITMDADSTISDTHANITLPSGSVLVKNPKTATIGGVTYTTVYSVGSGKEATAKFEIYDVAFEDYTAETTPIDSWDIIAGGWFASWQTPEGETFYDMQKDLYNTMTPVRYIVCDEEGNPLKDGKAVAGETYKVFIEYEKVAVAFTIIDKNGVATPYTNKDEYTLVTFKEGDTLILVSGDYPMKAISESIKIDLNGNTLYQTGKTNSFTGSAGARFFLYSSKEGGRFIQGYTSAGSCGYFFISSANDVKMYVGYSDENTKSPYRIEMFTSSLAEIKSANTHMYMYNVDFYKVFNDNYGFMNFRGGVDGTASFNAENCNFYATFGVYLRQTTNTDPDTVVGTLNLKGCNVFGGALFGASNSPAVGTLVFNLEDVGFYGSMKEGTLVDTMKVQINIKGDFVTNFVPAQTTFGDKVLIPTTTTYTAEGTLVPSAGYGNGEKMGYGGDYTAAYKLVTKEEFMSMAYQNMTLDTNVVANLYLPVSLNRLIQSVTCGEASVLNREETRTIGGQEYFVIVLETAPKYGNQTTTIVVRFYNGETVEFQMSVANYAKALFALNGENNAYVADSQVMMKYVMNYIKEVAVKFGGADNTIFNEFDLTVDTNKTVTEEVKNTGAISAYVTDAALNLNAYAGFAFKVAAGFVGTVRVEMRGTAPVEKTYTQEAPAGENEILVLENVPAYLFRGDITITATPVEGEAVSVQFNLATYLAANNEAYVKALYAYSVEAATYNAKYPTVGTVN